jgi:hypothetical protein
MIQITIFRIRKAVVIKSPTVNQTCIDDFHESPFFTQDEALALRRREVLKCCLVCPQTRPISFVRRQTLKGYQSPTHVVCAFMGQEITDQVTTTTRYDATPILSVLFERIPLKRINLVTNKAGNH